jgi:hypothetical protein
MDENILDQLQREIDNARLNTDRESLARLQQNAFLEKDEKSMVKEQLDLSDQITRIDYLLKGYSLQPNQEGDLVWTAPCSEDMKVFSDYGIQMVMNTICFYLNQNTLLSNYKEEEIRQKMLEFTKELIWAVFMNYDKVFRYPSVEECITTIKKRLKKQTDISKYAYELQGRHDVTIEQIYAQKIHEIENEIEFEIEKVKQNLIKEKLKRFPLLVRVIQDTVHSTYQRAWNGQERASLRQHMTISESKGSSPLQYPKQGGFLGWGKK